MTKTWVLLKNTARRPGEESVEPSQVLGVYDDYTALEARVKRIAKANSKYPMRNVGERAWVIGPDYDEGFFGHRPVHLWAVEADRHPSG